jgi:hypothetical protein
MLINEILSMEAEELLNYKFSEHGFLIWPLARAHVLNQIYLKHTNSSISTARSEKLKFYEKISYLYNTIKGNPFEYSNYKIVFLLSQIACSIKKEGKYFNRLHDYFALEYPASTLIIEKSARKKYTLPRYFDNVALEDYMNIKPHLKSMFKRPKSKDVDTIKLFIKCLATLFKDYLDCLDLHKISNKLLKHAVTHALLYQNYIELFKKLKPTITFIYLASGGRKKIFAIRAAKELGIKVGEFQHGVITLAHPYYNYGECIFKSTEYKKYLPDYLLTWGAFWNNNMIHPSKKIIIGNPHFTIKHGEYSNIKKTKTDEKKVVLVISQGTITDNLVDITKGLSKILYSKKYEIIFRLHPGEVPFIDRYKDLYSLSNVKISKNGDIYDLLFHCDYIVACYSTVIFEGLGFRKPVFVLDNYWSRICIPAVIGKWFKNVDELYDLIISTDPEPSGININTEQYFASSWQKNYRDFIENEIKTNNNN